MIVSHLDDGVTGVFGGDDTFAISWHIAMIAKIDQRNNKKWLNDIYTFKIYIMKI